MIPNGKIPSASRQSASQTLQISSGKPTRVPKVIALENKNWLIHLHYTRCEFGICEILIKEELQKSNGMNEYANFIQGIILRHEGRIQESLEYFQKCHVLNPKSIDNIKQVSRSLSLLGRQKLSLEVLEEAKNISNTPDWSISHNLGMCHFHLGDLTKAKEYLLQAVQMSRQEKSFAALAKIHILENDVPRAIEVYVAALETSPDSMDLATSLGLLYMKVGDNQKAFEQFGSALAHHPDCPRALLGTALVMQNHRDYDVALSKYKVASVYIPESASLWNNIGMCFFGKKKLVAAISCLKRANFLSPLDWKILYNLGLVHISAQQYASAFHFLTAAINMHSDIGNVFLPLAITLTHLGDCKNAQLAFDKMIEHCPEDPLTYLNYSLFLYKQNKMDNANEAYSKFQNLIQGANRRLDNSVLKIASNLKKLLNMSSHTLNTGEKDPPKDAPRESVTSETSINMMASEIANPIESDVEPSASNATQKTLPKAKFNEGSESVEKVVEPPEELEETKSSFKLRAKKSEMNVSRMSKKGKPS